MAASSVCGVSYTPRTNVLDFHFKLYSSHNPLHSCFWWLQEAEESVPFELLGFLVELSFKILNYNPDYNLHR